MIRALALLAALALAAPAAAAPGMRGIAVGLYGDADVGRALDEIAAVGASHVALAVLWRQEDVRSTALAPARGLTISDDKLRETIRRARRAGLAVFLLPIVDVAKRKRGEWRGTLRPDDIDAWWRAYQRFILHYAEIAAAEEVALFAVGSELATTEPWRDRWYALISAVKRRYRGPLTYSANWDHYQAVPFWERLDYVGVTGYNELSGSSDASVAELTRAWTRLRGDLVGFAGRAGRPLVVTEVGWPSQDGAATRPWDYTVRAAVDLEEQRRCYAAFVAAWRGEGALAGVFFWDWVGDGGKADPGYTPRGKPAEEVLRGWFRLVESSHAPRRHGRGHRASRRGGRAAPRRRPGPGARAR
jgi:hypothetical protein